jgi:hypothetical protein
MHADDKINAAAGVGFLHYNDKAQPLFIIIFHFPNVKKDFISSRRCIQCV